MKSPIKKGEANQKEEISRFSMASFTYQGMKNFSNVMDIDIEDEDMDDVSKMSIKDLNLGTLPQVTDKR